MGEWRDSVDDAANGLWRVFPLDPDAINPARKRDRRMFLMDEGRDVGRYAQVAIVASFVQLGCLALEDAVTMAR